MNKAAAVPDCLTALLPYCPTACIHPFGASLENAVINLQLTVAAEVTAAAAAAVVKGAQYMHKM